jgi:hypothetical protein
MKSRDCEPATRKPAGPCLFVEGFEAAARWEATKGGEVKKMQRWHIPLRGGASILEPAINFWGTLEENSLPGEPGSEFQRNH